MHLEFTVPGKPTSWSVKLDRRHARIYPSPAVQRWQRKVRSYAQEAIFGKTSAACGPFPVPKDMPVVLEIISFATKPKGYVGKYDTRKPDATNIQKAIEDALTKVVYPDDQQVVSPTTHKRFAQPGGEPHVRIRIWEAGHRPGMWG